MKYTNNPYLTQRKQVPVARRVAQADVLARKAAAGAGIGAFFGALLFGPWGAVVGGGLGGAIGAGS